MDLCLSGRRGVLCEENHWLSKQPPSVYALGIGRRVPLSGGGKCAGEAMVKTWAVVQQTGKRMDLERGFEKMEVHWPTNPVAQKMFMEIQPGRLVDEGTLRLLTGRK